MENDFNWDEPVDPSAFIDGISLVTVPKDDDKEKDKNEDDDQDDFTKSESEEDDKDVSDDKDKEKDEDPEKKKSSKVEFGKQLAEFAERIGLESEDIEGSFEDIVDNRVQEVLDELPEEGKNFIRFLRAGGSPEEFLGSAGQTVSLTKLDLEKEENQVRLIVQTEIGKGTPPEEAEAYAEYLKTNGKLAAFAQKKQETLIEEEKKTLSEAVEKREKARKEMEKANRLYRNKLSDNLKNVTEIKLSKTDKESLVSSLTEPTEIWKNQKVTKFGKLLAEIVEAGDQRTLTLAKLVLDNMDLTSIKKEGEKEATTKIREKITRTDTNKRRSPTDFFSNLR